MQYKPTINQEKQRLLNQNKLLSKARSQSISKEGQHEIDINGIKVLFPFEPYECQRLYMEKVIEALQTGTSALLESPTGTGKTLALLCSVLAWTNHLRQDYAKLKEFEMTGNSLHKRIGIPNIIYSTRTHTQLNQCVQELKATAYHPRTAILGSREQLCVHPKISLERGSKQNAKCRSVNAPSSAKKCWFKMGSKHMNTITKAVISKHILDVEDLHLIGKDQGFCPYYHSIESCNDAEIIFMPYNYLVNPNIRPPSVNISGSIVIFDEAHNIESVCCDAVSFELKAETLAQCISEVQSILELNKSNEECMVSKEDLAGLKKILLNLEEVIENINIPISNGEGHIIKNGDYIFDVLKQAEITMDVKDTIMDVAEDVLRELVSPEAEQSASLTMSTANRNATKYGLEVFVSALKTIYGKNFKSDSFKVQVAVKKPMKTAYFTGTRGLASRSLCLWCFNPSVAIASLKNEVHSMILTSGTLSPLESFSCEMQIEFPIRLENTHLITNKQVYVGVLEKGPCSRILSSEYNVRTSDEYMQELGSTLVQIARRIPYGMLVFFASYSHMGNCTEYWQKHRLGNLSIMEQLEKNKHVICEPRGGGQSAVKQVFADYSNAVKHDGGAMLLAVMRGKVSEGMDFADNFARCVVIAGIPYPYIKDPRIQAKRQYMDVQCCRTNHNNKTKVGVNGQMWYQQQAIRAVNQAIGRVIRHRHDYGCIILADRRFARSKNQQNVSKWIRSHIKTVKNFGLLIRDMTVFFKNAKEFDVFMKKPKDDKDAEKFSFIKVKRELQNISINTVNTEVNQVLMNENSNSSKESNSSEENKFKRYARKRKMSDTLGNMKRFMSTPKVTPGHNIYKRKRTAHIDIASELRHYGSKPSMDDNGWNNTNQCDISFHGNTPMASSVLKRRMENNASQNIDYTQKEHETKKLQAIKLRLQSNVLSQTNYMKIHDGNKRKKKQNQILQIIKEELQENEYNAFRSTLRLLSAMKDSNDEREFDENVVTPFRALFSISKREHILIDLKRYIPKQFHDYYTQKLIRTKEINGNDMVKQKAKETSRKRKRNPNICVGAQRISSSQSVVPVTASYGNINRANRNYSKRSKTLSQMNNVSNQITLRMPINEEKRKAHYTLDDTFVKLRKLQNKNADVSQPVNKHKRKKKVVTKANGFDGVCRSLMASDHYRDLFRCIKAWKGIDGNDANVVENKKQILQNIVNVLIKSCGDHMKEGHMTNFRALSKGFDRILTKKEDKQMYHRLIQNADEMKPHLKKIYKIQMK